MIQTQLPFETDLKRVTGKIGTLILEFCRSHREFHVAELHAYVAEREQVAPASADRILRLLRREGQLNYEVVSRAKSLYRVLG